MEKVNWLDFKANSNPLLDAYRIARSNLLNTISTKKNIILAFTSPTAVTEKSAVVAGMAIVLAQAEYKTLVVDGNLANPEQHVLFGLNNQGIADGVLSGADLQDMIQTSVEQENLDILAGGVLSTNNGDILSNNAMRQFLNAAREKYDYILLDLPAVDEGANAIVMASKVDGFVLVITCGENKINELNVAKSQLVQAGATILGCVLVERQMD